MKKKFADTVKRALATALCLLSVMSLAACSDVTSQLGIATDPPPTQAQTNEDGNTVYTGAYGGMFDDEIGGTLAVFLNRTEEAMPYLSEALSGFVIRLWGTVISFAAVFSGRKDYQSEQDMLRSDI